jgi:uncharacterized protein YjbJ (UPF0337 family)
MDKDRIAGAAKQIKGAAEAGVGKIVGNPKLQVQGAVDKAAGKIQSAVGGARDSVRHIAKK